MNVTSPKVDDFLGRAEKWRDELAALRALLLSCGLSEGYKWNKPCYTFQDGNVAAIAGLKDYCWLMFFKGALLRDADQEGGLLTKAGENSQSMRVIRFTDVQQITGAEAAVKGYVLEAIAAERAGLKVDFKQNAALVFPDEFTAICAATPGLKAAFDALTPGRQRGYNLHFCGAKQSKTRTARVEKCAPRILDGKGLNDR